jgi:hypothetical protein
VLDHLGSDETLLLSFSEYQSIDPTEIAQARTILAGERPQES